MKYNNDFNFTKNLTIAIDFILKRKHDVIDSDIDFIKRDKEYIKGCHKFYVRFFRKLYCVDTITTLKTAYTIKTFLNSNINPKYIYDVTMQIDSVYGELENLGKLRNLSFDYRKYYEETVLLLKGNFNKNKIYFTMIDYINSYYVGSKPFQVLLRTTLYSSLHKLKIRNEDYTTNTERIYQDLISNYFPEGHILIVKLNNEIFEINPTTKLDDVKRAINYLDSGYEIEYIYDETDFIDSVVGNIDKFFKKIGIDKSQYFTTRLYENAIQAMNYNFTKNKILNFLKG